MMIDAPVPQKAPQAIAPASYDAQYDKARVLASAGQYDLAVAAYTALLAQSPGNADVLLGRGLAHVRMKRYGQAESDLRAASIASPAYTDVWSALGNVYYWSDRPALAVPAYTEAIKLQPSEPAHRIARASAYRDLGQRELARADLVAAGQLGGDRGKVAGMVAGLDVRSANPDVSVPDGYQWGAGVSSSVTRRSQRNLRGNDQTLSIRRYFDQGSLGFETLSASRFDQRGHAWALDGYVSLWGGAYANLRYQKAPAERLFPRYSWRAELFQSVGNGWELSASDDHLQFGDSAVTIYGVAVARYVGDFYVRLRHTSIVSDVSRSSGDRLVVRYYYSGNADDYAEMTASRGRSEDALSLSGARQQSGGASVSYMRYPARHWGYKIGASYARESGIGSERGLSGALFLRW